MKNFAVIQTLTVPQGSAEHSLENADYS